MKLRVGVFWCIAQLDALLDRLCGRRGAQVTMERGYNAPVIWIAAEARV